MLGHRVRRRPSTKGAHEPARAAHVPGAAAPPMALRREPAGEDERSARPPAVHGARKPPEWGRSVAHSRSDDATSPRSRSRRPRARALGIFVGGDKNEESAGFSRVCGTTLVAAQRRARAGVRQEGRARGWLDAPRPCAGVATDFAAQASSELWTVRCARERFVCVRKSEGGSGWVRGREKMRESAPPLPTHPSPLYPFSSPFPPPAHLLSLSYRGQVCTLRLPLLSTPCTPPLSLL